MDEATPPASPLLPREVRHGAYLWVLGVVQFLLAMVVVQLAWTHPYSLTQNYISDLGNTSCGLNAKGVYICSPLYYVFNDSIIALGVLLIIGAVWVRHVFPPRALSKLGVVLFVVAGIGAAGVGFFPENVDLSVHSISALLAFVGGALGALVFAAAVGRSSRWWGFWTYSVVLGAVGLGSWILAVLLAFGVGNLSATLGPGGVERLIGFPTLLWGLFAGLQFSRAPVFAPTRNRLTVRAAEGARTK